MEKSKPGPTASHMYKRFMMVMAEIDHKKRPWVAAAIIAIWVALTFLQDACAGYFFLISGEIVGGKYQMLLPLMLTLAEAIACLGALKFECSHRPFLESICLALCSHSFGSFVKNLWLQTKDHESGLVGWFLEPVLALGLIFLLKGSYINHIRSISLVLACAGLTLASVNLHTVLNTDRSATITLLCGVFITSRNLCVTYWQEENVVIKHRSPRTLVTFFSVALLLAIGMTSLLYREMIVAITLVAFTCILHVGVTYIMCSLMLAKFSIPSVCVLTMCVQVIETQFFITSSHRPAVVVGVAACAMFIIGLYLYTYDIVETGHIYHSHQNVSNNEMFTRLQFLLFFASAVGVLVYVLQPRISHRDLNTLSYVGLDTVIRKLFSIDLPEDHEH